VPENESIPLIATTAFGLEAIVKRELADLGYEGRVVSPGWIEFFADRQAICRANLWLRSADRVLIRVARFEAEDFDALFEGTKALAWDKWIPADGRFPVIGRSIRSQLSSVPACQRAVKRAIVDSLLAAHGVQELVETGADYKVEIALLNNQATLTIDTTGPSLHKRAYRQAAAVAPLKETLGASLVALSFWKPGRPLLDPFCGSGTILIEAALMGRNIAPGMLRSFASEKWPILTEASWNKAREEARDLVREPFEERLVGTDVDGRVLQFARANAEHAGVAELIHFQQRDFVDLTSAREYGCVVTNPPYGERLGDHKEHEELYCSIPEVLRRLPTWSHFILTSYPNFESLIQRKADRRRKLYNGRIECTYYQFHGPAPVTKRQPASEPSEATDLNAESETVDNETAPNEIVGNEIVGNETAANEIVANETAANETALNEPVPQDTVPNEGADQRAVVERVPERDRQSERKPVFGGLDAKAMEQAELFRRRLQKRARHLRRWPTRQDIHCFRLYERDIPEIPLVVDRLEDCLHITEYDRPHDRDLAQHADWLDLMSRAAGEALDVSSSRVFMKRRQRQRGTEQYQRVGQQGFELEVREGGLRFLLNLSDYIDTGLFLDHRQTRAMVRDEASKKRFLNLFAYTGAFTVYAADGSALETTSVDSSRTYLTWAQRNLDLNGLDDPQKHHFVRNDVRKYLDSLPDTELFDVVVVDPPTFSNRKDEPEYWAVQDHHVELLKTVHAHLADEGTVYFSTNFRRFKLDEQGLASYEIREISSQTVPADFRNQRIHRCWKLTSAGTR
jgi:23S rRNA (guanine2445-N2)-methyltransferase / 23S rRNA (guanine2069-N7)-methyltransferase